LIVRYAAEFSRRLVDGLWRGLPWLAKPLAVRLTQAAQEAAEKKNAVARSRVLRSEDYLENVLAFTGAQE
jgi:hypothetical protein